MGGYGYGYGYGHGTYIVTWVFDTNCNDFAQLILGRRDWICVGMLVGTLRKRIRERETSYIALYATYKEGLCHGNYAYRPKKKAKGT